MRLQLVTDKELVNLYLAGDERAFAELLNRHKDKIYTTIYLFVKDELIAEDIFQETFIKVIETLRKNKYYEEGKFAPWVLRIAYNLCVDYYRKTKRTPVVTMSDGQDIFKVLPFDTVLPDQKIAQEQVASQIQDLIAQLPDEQKEVVLLRHYADLSFKEIADMTNVSINTALGRMRYALINIRRMIQEKQIAL